MQTYWIAGALSKPRVNYSLTQKLKAYLYVITNCIKIFKNKRWNGIGD